MKSSFFIAVHFFGQALTQATFPVVLNSTFATSGARNVRIDTGTYGPPVEEVHYFYDQWPIGLAGAYFSLIHNLFESDGVQMLPARTCGGQGRNADIRS